MSVNRLTMTAPLLCARPEALMAAEMPTGSTVIIDLGSGWTTDKARSEAQATLEQYGALAATLLRIRRPDDELGQEAITRLAALRPQGFVLSGCRDAADIQRLDVVLRVAEARHGLEAGSIAILAEIGDSSDFFLSPTALPGVSERLWGLVFDGEALTKATASEAMNTAAGRIGAPLLFARAIAVLKAKQAGLPCHEMIGGGVLGDDLHIRQQISLADGFAGVVVRTPQQLAALSG
ncbi:MAG TPA: hypothetical protein VL202_08755 [Pararhizobium sp.]|uniref:aldolase/citrate lyase family protein n=1 Tax=Pararhizobium sp. TaxID=1977563 RepID=UPI002CEB8E49|nr:hypothetical protein [Pararhizobium sp.]HTO31252.1 hypothetical protein [Pararhizobium sp.]